MPRDIVAIGASAGGVGALAELFSSMPSELPASFFVTVHFPSHCRSVLPHILERAGSMPASHPKDGEFIEQGRIYVAPPDHHLTISEDRIAFSNGPKENGHRPSIDAMFRSLASHYGDRVIGVVLTGMLDDGVAGLMAIKARGGLAVAQDPEDAVFAAMPASAIKSVGVDRIATIAKMGGILQELLAEDVSTAHRLDQETQGRVDAELSLGDVVTKTVRAPEEVPGELTMLTCPDCHGSLWELEEAGVLRFRCHLGHAYAEESFLAAKSDEVESSLWFALRAMEEHCHTLEKMIQRAQSRGHVKSSQHFQESLTASQSKADVIRHALLRVEAAMEPQEGRNVRLDEK